jgi:hypothetical protein
MSRMEMVAPQGPRLGFPGRLFGGKQLLPAQLPAGVLEPSSDKWPIAGQVSPDKNVILRYTTAAFAVSLNQRALSGRVDLPGNSAVKIE